MCSIFAVSLIATWFFRVWPYQCVQKGCNSSPVLTSVESQRTISARQTHPIQFTDGTSVYDAEMWNPDTGNFTVMAPASVPRNYHSIGLLLPDARVFNGGGGLGGNCKWVLMCHE